MLETSIHYVTMLIILVSNLFFCVLEFRFLIILVELHVKIV